MSADWAKSSRPRGVVVVTSAAAPGSATLVVKQPNAARIVPIILAAGASTRMGAPKALCDFDGRPCLQLALDACHDAGLGTPIVVLGFWAAQIRARVPLATAAVRFND